MILTVTTNSALDRVLFIERFLQGQPMRASKFVDCVGGKGFDVSVALRGLGVETVGLGIVAGRRGMDLVNHMKGYGIQLDLVWGSGETRLAHVIVETERHDHSHIITLPPAVEAKQREELLRLYRLRLATTAYVVIAGSTAPGLPEDFYKTLIGLAQEANKPILVDCHGESMRQAVLAEPTIAKMNRSEFSQTFQVTVDSEEALLKEGSAFVDRYPYVNLVITDGKAGIWTFTPNEIFQAVAPSQEAVNAAGAGDAASAALVWRLSMREQWPEALRWAAAVSAASVLTEATAEVNPVDVTDLIPKTNVKAL
jgi:1-phosphofructokinase family hexose kinase